MTEKRKIKNVFAQGNYNCIACSPYNPIGFKLQFYEEGDYITASWNPQHNYEGYPEFYMAAYRLCFWMKSQPGQFILKPKHRELREE